MTDTQQPSRPRAHFERLYDADPDPWNFATSPYERDKYAASLAALGTRRFTSGLEIGCSIGVLTHRLAGICDRLLGVDIAPAAVAAARLRCAADRHVTIEPMHIPAQWPQGQFDLIVLSEILYFLSEPDLRRVAAHTLCTLAPGGIVLLVNYTGATGDPTTGDRAATLFIDATTPPLHPTLHQREPHYRLDLLTAAPQQRRVGETHHLLSRPIHAFVNPAEALQGK